MSTPEGEVQKYAVERFKALGGLGRKIRYEGRNGCPDYLFILPGGRVIFVEFKARDGKAADPHQAREHARYAKRGVDVYIIGSKRAVDQLIASLELVG